MGDASCKVINFEVKNIAQAKTDTTNIKSHLVIVQSSMHITTAVLIKLYGNSFQYANHTQCERMHCSYSYQKCIIKTETTTAFRIYHAVTIARIQFLNDRLH